MRSRTMAAIIATAVLIGALDFTQSAYAQPAPPSSGSRVVPIVIGAAVGATVGAIVWPMMFPAAAAATYPAAQAVAAAPAAMMAAPAAAAEWGWGSFMTTRALVGAVIGGGIGWLFSR